MDVVKVSVYVYRKDNGDLRMKGGHIDEKVPYVISQDEVDLTYPLPLEKLFDIGIETQHVTA